MRKITLFTLTLVLVSFVGQTVLAQQAKGRREAPLGLKHGEVNRGVDLPKSRTRNYYEMDDLVEEPMYRPFGRYSPYYVLPWGWYLPQTHKYKAYPSPVAIVPRLGLNYPYAWQMGIQMPGDASPLEDYTLGPYTGVVNSPQWPAWLYESYKTVDPVVELMRQGKYRTAGRYLAEKFRSSDDLKYSLLMTEALFALGKYSHAELVLRHAMTEEGVLETLPENVAAHFPSEEVFEEKLDDLVTAGKHNFLTAYLLLFSQDGSKGLDALAKLIAENPKDTAPVELYRHFFGKAFGKGKDAKQP